MSKKDTSEGIPGTRFLLSMSCLMLAFIVSALGSLGCGMRGGSSSSPSGCDLVDWLAVGYLVLTVFFGFCKREWVFPVAIVAIPIIFVIFLTLL